jgi:hypothetical protein
MRILHAPENIGGMAGVLARAQVDLGHQARSYAFASNHFKFPADIVMKRPESYLECLQKAVSFSTQFDVFHFYFGSSLLGYTLKDVRWLSRLGKKVFFHFCGCDARDEKATIMKYPISACACCFPKLCNANRRQALTIASQYGRTNFVSTPDLLEFVDRSVLLPQVVDFDLINEVLREPEPPRDPNKLVIAHAPTNRMIKGTSFLFEAVAELQTKGMKMELLLIEQMNHADALRRYREADIALDQLLVGSYGMVSAEMMALGVPTIVYIRDDLLPKYPQAPRLINATPLNLKNVLARLYDHREELESYRASGQEYAMEVHHPARLASQCLAYYGR